MKTREPVLTADIFGRVGKQAHNPKPNDKDMTFFLILCSERKHGIACRPPVKVAKKDYTFCMLMDYTINTSLIIYNGY